MKIISTGEKIKQLRIDIGLNQDDLTNDEITRSLISMIENNKRNLTYRAAKVIADSLNQYYINLGKKITPDYLLESEVEQAQRLIKERLDEMQQLIDHPMVGNENQVVENFKKLIEFARQWKLDSMVAQLYETRGQFHFNTYQYNEAISDFISALEYHLEKCQYDTIASLYCRVASSYYQLMLIDQALMYYNRAHNIISLHTIDNYDYAKMLLIYNKALCYYSLKKFDLAIKEIISFKELPNPVDDEYFYSILLLEANTYRDIHNYEKAKKIYDKLLKQQDKLSVNIKMLVYENYAELYQIKSDYEKSLFYINISFEFQSEIEANYIPYLYLNKAKIYWKLNRIEDCIALIEKGMLLAKKVSKIQTIVDLYFLLIEVYLGTEEYLHLEKNLQQLEDIISGNKINDVLIDVYIYYIEYFCQIGDIKKCMEYTAKLRASRKSNLI